MASIRLREALPEFAQELEGVLLASKEPELATQIPELQIARRCDCEDDFCATFYSNFEPSDRPYKDAHCLELNPKEGMIILDVVSGRLTCVEVLFRDDVRAPVRVLFP